MKKILLLTLFLSFNVSAYESMPPPYYLLRIASEVSGIPLKGYGEDLQIYFVTSDFKYFKEHPGLLGLYNKKNGYKQIIILNNEDTTLGELNTRIIHEMVHYLQDPDLTCEGMDVRGQVELDAYMAENKFRIKYKKELNLIPYEMDEFKYLVEGSKETTTGVC
jgi:hypothetical protein